MLTNWGKTHSHTRHTLHTPHTHTHTADTHTLPHTLLIAAIGLAGIVWILSQVMYVTVCPDEMFCFDDDVDNQQCSNRLRWGCVDFIMNDVLCRTVARCPVPMHGGQRLYPLRSQVQCRERLRRQHRHHWPGIADCCRVFYGLCRSIVDEA